MPRVMIVDDEIHMRKILATMLKQDGHLVRDAAGLVEAKDALSNGDYDVVITDHKMPDGNGIDVLNLVKRDDPSTAVVFLTAVGSIELAVESMRLGAFDFLIKPFLPEAIRATVTRAAEHAALLRENSHLKQEMTRLAGSAEIIGISPAITHVREEIAKVAPTKASVLICGETGTGKELVARAIHKSSSRACYPFMALNCAAIPESLLESELFGHERGAFTGADRVHEGLFEAANLGTLFLDEVAELSAAAQAKLLRVLNDGSITRVGANRSRTVDVRVIAATHRDLRKCVSEQSFREDLYYRLAVFPITIPALRERREDLPLLCDHFLRLSESELKLPQRHLSREALERLGGYDFPGNIRELRNLLERACILSSGEVITPAALPKFMEKEPAEPEERSGMELWLAGLPGSIDIRELLTSVERELVLRMLAATGGVQAEAARRLGLSRSDLGYKLAKYKVKTSVS